MPINPITGLEEEEEKVNVTNHLMQKMGLGQYSPENRQKLVDESMDAGFGTKLRAALAAAGAGIGGGDAMGAGNAILNRDRAERMAKVDSFDKNRNNAIQDYSLNRDFAKNSREDEVRSRKQDPNSEESKMAREIAKQFSPGMSFDGYSAEKLESVLPSIQKLAQLKSEAADRQLKRESSRTPTQEKPLPTGSLENLASSDTALKAIESIQSDANSMTEEGFNVMGVLNPARYIPETDTNDTLVAARAKRTGVAKTIGRFLEGGKLTDEDAKKYESMLPTENDSAVVRQKKVGILKELVNNKLLSDRDSLSKGGYSVPESGLQSGSSDPEAESIARQKRIAELRAKKSKVGGL